MRIPGSSVFQDKHHLSDGSHFPEALAAELNSADVFLALVSPAWLQSEWCRREFSIFTEDATNSLRLHKIVPVLWVETPEIDKRSLDLVARTMANISYSDWRDLRYENWDNSDNQRQVGKLAESIRTLVQEVPNAKLQLGRGSQPTFITERLSHEKEKLLLFLNMAADGLPESALANFSSLGHTHVSVYLHDLQAAAYVRQRLRAGQRTKHWLITVPGQAYLVRNELVA